MTLFTHRTAEGRCPCGAAHAACGPPSDVVPVDANLEEVAAVGAPLKKYKVTSPWGVETVMKLNDGDAAARGLSTADMVDAPEAPPAPEPEGPGREEELAQAEEKASPPAPNKARAASPNKGRGARGGS